MKSAEQILDDNKVRVAGSMQNRILSAMSDYSKQECNYLRKQLLVDFIIMEWISIKNSRPEYMQTCIIHDNLGFVTMAQFGGGTKGKEVFVHDQVWHIATHWMPLPQPPKI